MIAIRNTQQFKDWLAGLRDRQARARITVRLARLAEGNAGDIKSVGGGIAELRIDHGPGYRVYLTQRGSVLVILLVGGDKTTQDRDIATARQLAANLPPELTEKPNG